MAAWQFAFVELGHSGLSEICVEEWINQRRQGRKVRRDAALELKRDRQSTCRENPHSVSACQRLLSEGETRYEDGQNG